MIKSRLLILADRLEAIAKRPPKGRTFELSAWLRKEPCGTVCCAVGEAMLIPRFKKLGLGMKANHMDAHCFSPHFRNDTGWSAVDAFFGLSGKQAEKLFSPVNYSLEDRNPSTVAARLREFVKSKAPQASDSSEHE